MSGGLSAEQKRELIAWCWCRLQAERCGTCARLLDELAASTSRSGPAAAGGTATPAEARRILRELARVANR